MVFFVSAQCLVRTLVACFGTDPLRQVTPLQHNQQASHVLASSPESLALTSSSFVHNYIELQWVGLPSGGEHTQLHR